MRKVFVLVLVSLIVLLTMPLIFTNVASADDTTPPTVTITSNTNVRSCMNANPNMYHCSVPGFTGTATDDIGVVRVTMYYYGPGGPDDVIEYEIDYDPATHQFSGFFCGWDFGPSLYTAVEYCNDLGLDGWCTKAPIPAEGTYLNHLHDCPYDSWCDTSSYHGAQIRAYDAEGNYGYDTFNVDVDTCPYCSNEKPYVCYEWDVFGNMKPKCVDLDTDPNHCGSCGNDCDDLDGCYPYNDGCEDRNYYYCSGGSCGYSYSNRHADYHDDWIYYCTGDQRWKHRLLHDFYCGGTCTDHTSWVDDQLVEDCNDRDGCYAYGNGCEDRDYSCSGGSCAYTYSRHTDYDEWVYYCKGDEVWKHRLFHDFYCEGGTCTDHTSWEDDQLVGDCDGLDNYYCKGDEVWFEDWGCVDGSCVVVDDYFIEDCDDLDNYYCNGDEVWFEDWGCIDGSCVFIDDDFIEDCDDLDNYYCKGDEVWFEDWSCIDGSCVVVDDYFIEDCDDLDNYYCKGDEVWFKDWGCVDGSCVFIGDYFIEACNEDYWDCVDSSTVGLYHCTCVDGTLYWDVIDTYDCLEGEECVDGECQEVPEFPAGVTAVFGATFFIFLMMRRKYVER